MATTSERAVLHELQAFAGELARRACALADDVEVLVLRRDVVSFALENRTLAPELKLGRLQVGLRALKAGRLAAAATTSLSVDENLSALKAALPAGRPTQLAAFSDARLDATADGLDEGLSRFARDPAALQQLAVDVRDRGFAAMQAHPHVTTLEGRVTLATKWKVLATRSGSGAAVENMLSAGVEVNSLRSEREVRRTWTDEDSLRDVAATAVRNLPIRRISPADLGLGPASRVPAILAPELVEALLRHAAHDKFLASSLVSGQTRLAPGTRVASEAIRLVDTGLARELWRPFDDELTAKGETVLVDGGVFRSFVSSRASARLANVPETGNGVRHPILAEEFTEAPVRDALGGLSMDAGSTSLDALIATIPAGVLPRSLLGIHGADRGRTTFSATVADGVAIKDGKVVGQLAPGQWNLAGRVLPGDDEAGLLEEAVVSRERQFTGSAVLPYLRTTLTAG